MAAISWFYEALLSELCWESKLGALVTLLKLEILDQIHDVFQFVDYTLMLEIMIQFSVSDLLLFALLNADIGYRGIHLNFRYIIRPLYYTFIILYARLSGDQCLPLRLQ